jgi:hypothetical protein
MPNHPELWQIMTVSYALFRPYADAVRFAIDDNDLLFIFKNSVLIYVSTLCPSPSKSMFPKQKKPQTCDVYSKSQKHDSRPSDYRRKNLHG